METLEEAAERWNEKQTTLEFGKPHNAPNRIKAFIQGAKWQQEKMYSDMQEYAEFCIECDRANLKPIIAKDWFEQLKKK